MLPSPWWALQLPGWFLISRSVGLQATCVFRGTLYHDPTPASETLQGLFPIIASVGPCMNKPLKFRMPFHRILPGLIFSCNSKMTKSFFIHAPSRHIFYILKEVSQVVHLCKSVGTADIQLHKEILYSWPDAFDSESYCSTKNPTISTTTQIQSKSRQQIIIIHHILRGSSVIN